MLKNKQGCKKKILYLGLSSVLIIILLLILFNQLVTISPPEVNQLNVIEDSRIEIDSTTFTVGNNWLKKNRYGLWELFVEGKPYERGYINGVLTKELIKKQESAFVDQIKEMVPNSIYLFFLKAVVGWFNRNLNDYIDLEFQKEIYGVSKSASDEFDYIAPGYQRLLNYHAAHDIGHALAYMRYVGCTSFSAWNAAAKDSSLIVGRNFDFYVGDEFAEEKIVAFVNPSDGYKFMMVTWGGMIGVVSGMNVKGLTVTLNAAKSDYPISSATPISLLAREILQYAKTIDEAYQIAESRTTFVAESIMIGSKLDNRTAIIEKTPEQIDLFTADTNYIICSNHYQSDALYNSTLNKKFIEESSSLFRYKRVEELLNNNFPLDISSTAEILRNRNGLGNVDIGLGNEKAINQLIAHHSVIFNATELIAWVSSNPYQLGSYVAYDLNDIFSDSSDFNLENELSDSNLTLPADDFLYTSEYENYIEFLSLKNLIAEIIAEDTNQQLSKQQINGFIESNPESYLVYQLLGDYFLYRENEKEAVKNYQIALGKEIATIWEKESIKNKLTELKKK